MPAKTKEDKINLVGLLIEAGKTNVEIAKELGCTVPSITMLARHYFGGNPNYLKKHTKHKHLHKKALELFLTHSFNEVAEKLGLKKGELKSCMSYAYKDKNLAHIRKDKRRRDHFSGDELIKMLRYSGIFSRERVSEIIKRDGARVIKEKMNSMGVASRNINGLNLASFQRFFNAEPIYSIKTTAGPNVFKFRIVPWFHVVEAAKSQEIPKETILIFQCFEMFQDYIWKGKTWEMMARDPLLRGMRLIDHHKCNKRVIKI